MFLICHLFTTCQVRDNTRQGRQPSESCCNGHAAAGSERDQSQEKKPEWQWEMQAAGMVSLRLGSVENESSSQSSDSEAEHCGPAQVATKKVRENKIGAKIPTRLIC